MAGTERLKWTAMFVPIEEGFPEAESMSDEEEHESRCGESFLMCALNPQHSTATSARCSFPLAIRVQHGARGEDLVCGSAASLPPCHENETLRSRQNQRSAGLTSQ